jgi:hypothetical protein
MPAPPRWVISRSLTLDITTSATRHHHADHQRQQPSRTERRHVQVGDRGLRTIAAQQQYVASRSHQSPAVHARVELREQVEAERRGGGIVSPMSSHIRPLSCYRAGPAATVHTQHGGQPASWCTASTGERQPIGAQAGAVPRHPPGIHHFLQGCPGQSQHLWTPADTQLQNLVSAPITFLSSAGSAQHSHDLQLHTACPLQNHNPANTNRFCQIINKSKQ